MSDDITPAELADYDQIHAETLSYLGAIVQTMPEGHPMSPALGWTDGLDVEVATLPNGRRKWHLYRRNALLAHGIARNRFTLSLAVRFAMWRHSR